MNKKKMPFLLLLVSGIVLSFFAASLFIIYSFYLSRWSPTARNTEHLLLSRKYDQALALAESRMGRSDSAALFLEKGKIWMTIAWEKQNSDGWSKYGTNDSDWLDIPEADSAEFYLLKSASAFPEGEGAYYLGVLFMDRGWYSKAHEMFLQILSEKPDHFPTRNTLGVLYTRMHLYSQGQREFMRAWELDSGNVSVAKNMGSLYLKSGNNIDSAMIWFNRYLNAKPLKDPDISYIRTEMNDLLSRYPEYTPIEPMEWRGERIFSPRNRK